MPRRNGPFPPDSPQHHRHRRPTRNFLSKYNRTTRWQVEILKQLPLPRPTPLPPRSSIQPTSFLSILQINANGIKSLARRREILALAASSSADIICIQESNLCPADPSPKFDDWIVAGRADRTTHRLAGLNASRGYGGALTLVRPEVQFSPVSNQLSPNDDIHDVITTNLFTNGRSSPITLVNAYFASSRPGIEDERPNILNFDALPHTTNTIICADLNGHSGLWDPFAQDDNRGNQFCDWLDDNNMTVANDGSATRISPDAAKPSAPDVTAHHSSWTGRIDWSILDSVGSDHLPILTKVRLDHPSSWFKRPAHATWAYKKADWQLFGSRFLSRWHHFHNRPTSSTAVLSQRFNQCIHTAATKAIPKGARIKAKVWWTPPVALAVSSRNTALKNWRASPDDPVLQTLYREASKNASDTIFQSKIGAWREITGSLSLRDDVSKVWNLVHAIDGTSPSSPSGAALNRPDGTPAITDKDKANCLLHHYSKISSNSRTPAQDKPIRLEVNQALATPCLDHTSCGGVYCTPFSSEELAVAIKNMKGRAAGPDGITPPMLKNLPAEGLSILLTLLNSSWTTGVVPSSWRSATIIPIPKPGKNRAEPKSYRPISLTSCVGKLLERLVNARLQYFLETNNKLAVQQAGFRKGRSTEEQIARTVTDVFDHFEDRPHMTRTVMVTVDMSAAYDKVLRTGLLAKLCRLEVPPCIVSWTRHLLRDRHAKVSWNGTSSSDTTLKEGLPQGSSLAPTLWLTYIDDLATALQAVQGVQFGLYADDIVLYAHHANIPTASQRIQQALDILGQWADTWGMSVSSEKTESILFSTHVGELNGKKALNLLLNGTRLPQRATVRFLGITLDSQLRFTDHISSVRKRVTNRLQVARALAGRTWGATSDTLRRLHKAFVEPVALYGAATYLSFAAPSQIAKIETTQTRAARLITGCTADSRNAAVLREAGLLPLQLLATQRAASLREHLLRLPPDIPAHASLIKPCHRRLLARGSQDFRPTFRAVSSRLALQAGLEGWPRQPLRFFGRTPPWTVPLPGSSQFITTASSLSRRTDPPDLRRKTAETILASLPKPDLAYFTDGSVEAGTKNGGGGVVLISDDAPPTSWSIATGALNSSYEAEMKAMLSALAHAQSIAEPASQIHICSDSLSAIQRLSQGKAAQLDQVAHDIWTHISALRRASSHISFVWIPGHCGIMGNTLADAAANEGRLLPQTHQPISRSTAKAAIARATNSSWDTSFLSSVPPLHHHRQATGGKPLPANPSRSRPAEVLLHQLRVGKSPLCRATRASWNPEVSENCPTCDTPETVEHILCVCPRFLPARLPTIGPLPPLSVLQECPDSVVDFLHRAGLLAPI